VATPPQPSSIVGSTKAIEKHNLNRRSETNDMAIGTAMSYEEKKYFSDPSAESYFHSVQISRNEKELKKSV